MFVFVKDEYEPSPSSMPDQLLGHAEKAEDGRQKVAELLDKVLFQVGHPRVILPITLTQGAITDAVGGPQAQIDIELSCHPLT